MAFFENFPIIGYSITGERPVQRKVVTDILSRVKMLSSIKTQTLVYYTYDVQDGETPEIIASKYYDNSNRHWLILFANDIIDPFYDWPLTYTNFLNYIKDKYGSYQLAQTTIHHYEKVITKIDSVTNTTTVRRYIIDQGTYNNLPSTNTQSYNLQDGNVLKIITEKKIVYSYDYEEELNESKRKIKIIDKKYVTQIENELTALLSTNV